MKKLTALMLALMLALAMVPATAFAASGTAATEAELVAALAAAVSGDTVTITASFAVTEVTFTIPIGVTVTANAGVVLSTSGGANLFIMLNDSTITGLTIVKTDKATQQIINMAGNNVKLTNCNISGQYNPPTDPEIVRAVAITAGTHSILISGNRFSHLRQPAYLEGDGVITNNYAEYTKGWVICHDSNFTFTGNTFAYNNPVDMAIIKNTSSVPDNYKDMTAALSTANGGAYVEDQVTGYSAAGGVLFAKGEGTVVTAGVDPTFTITIPAAVDFGKVAKGTGDEVRDFVVSASGVVIEPDKKIDVSVTSDFLLSGGGTTLAYRLYNDDAAGATVIGDGGLFASFTENGNKDGNVKLDRSQITVAAAYQDTMVFTIAYVNKP